MNRPYVPQSCSLRSRYAAILVSMTLVGATACGSSDPTTTATTASSTTVSAPVEAIVDPGDGGDYRPQLDPANFVEGIDNPYLPLTPGSRWVYAGDSKGEPEDIVVVVTDQTRVIEGITAVVVRDTVHVGGLLVEDTFDWFAQDREGNVWYLGEDSSEIGPDGEVLNKDGSWEYGKNGALPGIVMPAIPRVGDAFRQEYQRGIAEDMAEVLRIEPAHSISLGDYADVVVTEDWTPLEPEVVENKWYAPGIGKIYGTHESGPPGTIELVEFTPGS